MSAKTPARKKATTKATTKAPGRKKATTKATTKAPTKAPAVRKKRITQRRNPTTRADVIHKLTVAADHAAQNLLYSIKNGYVIEEEQLAAYEAVISRVVPKLRNTEVSGSVEHKQELVIDFSL